MRTSPEAMSPVMKAVADSRRTFIGLAGFSVFINLLMLTGPLYMLQVYDRVLTSASVPTLVALTLLVVLLYATMGVLDWCRQSLFSAAASQIESRLSPAALEATLSASLNDAGRSNEQTLRDLRTLRRIIASPVLPAAFDGPMTPLFFLVLFMLHWAFGLLALFGAIVLITLAVINQAVTRKTIQRSDSEEQLANLRASEMSRNVEVIEALGMRERMARRWREQFEASDAALTDSGETLGVFSSTTKAFRMLLQSGILGLGAWLTIMHESTAGAMVAASILMGRAIAPIEQLVGQWRSIIQARTAWGNLSGSLKKHATGEAPMELPPLQGRLDFEAVTAGAPGQRTPVLRNLSVRIEAGECFGIIGPSASGKSTFARVAVGLWPAMAGKVRIDGADIIMLPREWLGAQMGYLPQQVDLFSGSVRDNIARFDPAASAENVVAAAEAAGCHDLILRLPQGYDTEIGQRGAYLSAGQRQRIGLARAMFGAPKLVVLDEPNSNLDADGEAALQNAIGGMKLRGATVIIIAHRPAAISHCDRLMVLDQGQIRAVGPRDEVLRKLAGNAGPRVTPIRKESQNG